MSLETADFDVKTSHLVQMRWKRE